MGDTIAARDVGSWLLKPRLRPNYKDIIAGPRLVEGEGL